jgi:hypothetical protein
MSHDENCFYCQCDMMVEMLHSELGSQPGFSVRVSSLFLHVHQMERGTSWERGKEKGSVWTSPSVMVIHLIVKLDSSYSTPLQFPDKPFCDRCKVTDFAIFAARQSIWRVIV